MEKKYVGIISAASDVKDEYKEIANKVSNWLVSEDYNLMPIKIYLFFFSFGLFFTVNTLFFTDSTMHKINEDNGKFNFIYQIPQIIYSTLISSFFVV